MIINGLLWYLADLAWATYGNKLWAVPVAIWYVAALFAYPTHKWGQWACTFVLLADLMFRSSGSYWAMGFVCALQLTRPYLYRQLKHDPFVHALCATVFAAILTAFYPVAWTAFPLCAILLLR